MNIADLETLPWLVPLPDGLPTKVKDAARSGDLPSLVGFAKYQTAFSQNDRLGGYLLSEIVSSKVTACKALLFSNKTSQFLTRALCVASCRWNQLLLTRDSGYDQVWQGLATMSECEADELPNWVIIVLDHQVFDGSEATAERVLQLIDKYIQFTAKYPEMRLVVSTIPPPATSLFGAIESQNLDTPTSRCDQFNNIIKQRAQSGDITCADLAGLATLVGLLNWHDPVYKYIAKLPFSPTWSPLAADYIARAMAAALGHTKRVLILDLDNTLWGGLIAEDGLNGIEIGNGTARGEAFLELQRHILSLSKRGIVLAACSKNQIETARLPFNKHPDMLLKEEDFSVFQANWDDKAHNVRAISKVLNLTTDHFVFLDDSPVERALVRRELPDVSVPELTENPSDSALLLSIAGYFEAPYVSKEDLSRADAYKGNVKRAELKNHSTDLDSFYESLQMTIDCQPFDDIGRSRVLQLISKSNQFNLTTRRHTQSHIRKIEKDPRSVTMQIRLTDRFGDNGIISIIILLPTDENETYEIDSWIMSCRVIGRRVEEAALNILVRTIKSRGGEKLIGRYRPSAKNSLVKDHYKKLGFDPAQSEGDDQLCQLLLTDYVAPDNLPFNFNNI